MRIGAWSITPISQKIQVAKPANTRRSKVNSLVREALEIAISNWEFDGEYDKVSEAVTLIKEAQENE